MYWANIEFLVAALALLTVWLWLDDRPQRGARAARRAERRQQRARDAEAAAVRQADLDVLYRHYRTMVRYYTAGHDPAELAPPHLPSKGPFVAPQDGAGAGTQPSDVGSTHEEPWR